MTTVAGSSDNDELLSLAGAFALDAVDDDERDSIESALGSAPVAVRDEFHHRVREYQEALANHSHSTEEPAPEHLLERILESIADADRAAPPETGAQAAEAVSMADARRRRSRRLAGVMAGAAAAVVVAAGGIAIGHQWSGPGEEPTAGQVVAAGDVRTAVTDVAGGTATVVYSRIADAAVLVMNDVAPPEPDTVYQLWLMGDGHPPASVGMMDAAAVAPSTQVVVEDIDTSSALGISVEPAGGSPQPTTVVGAVTLS